MDGKENGACTVDQNGVTVIDLLERYRLLVPPGYMLPRATKINHDYLFYTTSIETDKL